MTTAFTVELSRKDEDGEPVVLATVNVNEMGKHNAVVEAAVKNGYSVRKVTRFDGDSDSDWFTVQTKQGELTACVWPTQ